MRNLSRTRRAAIAAFVALPLTATAAHAWAGTAHHATTTSSARSADSATRNASYSWTRHHSHTSAPTATPSTSTSTSTSTPSKAPTTSAPSATPSTSAPTSAPSTSTPSSAPSTSTATTGTAATGTGDVTSTAGVPAGTTLKPSGSVTVNTDGAVINGLDITGTLTINASNVTVENTRVTGGAFWEVSISDKATNVHLDHVSVDAKGMSGSEGSCGIVGPGTFSNVAVTGAENGFVPGSNSVITGSYVHNMAAPGSPHYDGIQIDGGVSNIKISGSVIDNQQDQTSAVMVDNYFGPISNVVVDGNTLMGGDYTVYADGSFSSSNKITGVQYTNNKMSTGTYGYGLLRDSSVTWSNNVDEKTGKTVTAG